MRRKFLDAYSTCPTYLQSYQDTSTAILNDYMLLGKKQLHSNSLAGMLVYSSVKMQMMAVIS